MGVLASSEKGWTSSLCWKFNWNRLLCEWVYFSCVGVLWNCGMKWVRVWLGGTEDYSDEQLMFALVLHHSCKINCATSLVTCVVWLFCFQFNSHRCLFKLISTGTIWLVLHGGHETHLHFFKSKFHWLSFFFFSCLFVLFQDLISLGVRGQIIPENLTLLLVRYIQVH